MADARRKRNQIAGQFIPHPRQMIESPAWRALSLAARKALDRIEIEHMNQGGVENGKLKVTFRQFEQAGVHPRFVAPALRELEVLGIIETTKRGYRGAAGTRQASEYRLTYRPTWNAGRTDADGTHEYLKIKTSEEAEAKVAAARKAADPRNIERSKIHSATRTKCGIPPAQSDGNSQVSRLHKVTVQRHPHKVTVLSISRVRGAESEAGQQFDSQPPNDAGSLGREIVDGSSGNESEERAGMNGSRVSLGQAARFVGVCELTLRRAIETGRLRAGRRDDPRMPAGGAYTIDPADLQPFRPARALRRAAEASGRRCLDCGGPISKRKNARFCCEGCQQNAYRRRKRRREGGGARSRRSDAPAGPDLGAPGK